MSSLFPVAGCSIYIGGQLSDKSTDFVASDFSTQTWTLVDGWSSMGTAGDTAAAITTSLINRGRDVKQKGTKNAGSMQNVFARILTDAGQTALIAAVSPNQSYAFKVLLNDAVAATSAVVTVTIAAPGVFTDTAHGLSIGDQVVFSTTGALPTGITAGTTYFIVAAGFTVNAYSVALTSGGAAITTTGTQSGVQTRTSVPLASQRYFVALVMSAAETGGGANSIRNLDATIEINSNIVTVAAIQ
jgi:hypothetical protein